MDPEEKILAEEIVGHVRAAKEHFMPPVQQISGRFYRCQEHCYETETTLAQAEKCKLRCNVQIARFNAKLESEISRVFNTFFKCSKPCKSTAVDSRPCMKQCQENAFAVVIEVQRNVLEAANDALKHYN